MRILYDNLNYARLDCQIYIYLYFPTFQFDILMTFCQEGRDLAVLYGLKFIETGAGIGHNIDQLLVGIVIQSR